MSSSELLIHQPAFTDLTTRRHHIYHVHKPATAPYGGEVGHCAMGTAAPATMTADPGPFVNDQPAPLYDTNHTNNTNSNDEGTNLTNPTAASDARLSNIPLLTTEDGQAGQLHEKLFEFNHNSRKRPLVLNLPESPTKNSHHESSTPNLPGPPTQNPPEPPTKKVCRGSDAATAGATSNKKVNNEQWDTMFERLKLYKAQHGDCLVPKRYTPDPKLGTWVETQRVQHKKLPRSTDENGNEVIQPNKRLTSERLQKLESIGFAWSAKHVKKNQKRPPCVETPPKQAVAARAVAQAATAPTPQPPQARRRPNETPWEDMFQRLTQYKKQYGNCLVPRKFDQDPKLSAWVETQRVLWNKDYKKLDATSAACGSVSLEYNLSGSDPPVPAPKQTGSTDDPKNKRLTPDRKKQLDDLGFVWSLRSKRIEDHWDQMFRQLVEYKNLHGDCLVPSRYEANQKLGKWVETQRYEYTKLQRKTGAVAGKTETSAVMAATDLPFDESKPRPFNPRLTEDRLRRLESIGFEWKVKHKMKRYYDKQWDQMFGRLLSFKEANGHCMVPKRYPPDLKLGTWVHTQRIQYRKLMAGKKVAWTEEEVATMKSCGEEVTYRLTEERRLRLESVGFVWSAREGDKGSESSRITRNSYDDQWDVMFDKLRQYKETHGHCLVPKRYKDDPKLGTWVDTQRVQFKKLKKKLAQQGKDCETDPNNPCADALDNPMSDDNEAPNNGVALSVSPKPLVGRLTDDRIRRLQNLGFVWSLRDDWQKHYQELVEFKNENGHCNVPARYAKNRRLGVWVSSQRQQYKGAQQTPELAKQRRSAPLTQERIQLLNALGFTWTLRSRESMTDAWIQKFEELKAFKAHHGHCLVPHRYEGNPELGSWVSTMRTQYRQFMEAREAGLVAGGSGYMTEERIRDLEAIGFVWVIRGGDGKKSPPQAPQMLEAVAPLPPPIEANETMHCMEDYIIGI